jgi:hypothetical protein
LSIAAFCGVIPAVKTELSDNPPAPRKSTTMGKTKSSSLQRVMVILRPV